MNEEVWNKIPKTVKKIPDGLIITVDFRRLRDTIIILHAQNRHVEAFFLEDALEEMERTG